MGARRAARRDALGERARVTSLPLAHVVDRVAFADPASGRKGAELKHTRARQAIVVVGHDPAARVIVLEAWADRVPTDDFIDRIFATNAQWKPRTFGIEANAMQSLFADAVAREARTNGVRLPLLAVTQPTKIDKIFRIRAGLQPVIGDRRLVIRDEQRALVEELEAFPNGLTVDVLDALESAIRLLPRRLVDFRDEGDVEAKRLAAHLRESGAPGWIVERRVAAVRAEAQQAARERQSRVLEGSSAPY